METIKAAPPVAIEKSCENCVWTRFRNGKGDPFCTNALNARRIIYTLSKRNDDPFKFNVTRQENVNKCDTTYFKSRYL